MKTKLAHPVNILILAAFMFMPTYATVAEEVLHAEPSEDAMTALGTTTRVSIASDGSQANSGSTWASISVDGRYVAFVSGATNLVTGDSNGAADIFIHDNQTGKTELVSISSAGDQGNSKSYWPSISTVGRYIAFTSDASNLVAGDTNDATDIFVRDRQSGKTTSVSVASDGSQGNGWSGYQSISNDGRYVAFASEASNLVIGDTNGYGDVFVHDRQTGTTERVSVDSEGRQANSSSGGAFISADGRYVTFESGASNLGNGDTNGRSDIFFHDRQTGSTERVSIASDGGQGDFDSSAPAPVSADGRYVTFKSEASSLIPGDSNDEGDIFVRDRLTGKTIRVSVATDGSQGNESSLYPSSSANGRYFAFTSFASNLVSGDTNEAGDIFIHDLVTSSTERISLASNGSQGNGDSYTPSVSATGRYIGFDSDASNLVSGDSNSDRDVFVHDLGEERFINLLFVPVLYNQK